MEAIVENKKIKLRLDDVEKLKVLSLWYFVAISAYMLLPFNKIYLAIRNSKQEKPSDHCCRPVVYNDEHFDAANPMTKTEGRIRYLKDVSATLQKNREALLKEEDDDEEEKPQFLEKLEF